MSINTSDELFNESTLPLISTPSIWFPEFQGAEPASTAGLCECQECFIQDPVRDPMETGLLLAHNDGELLYQEEPELPNEGCSIDGAQSEGNNPSITVAEIIQRIKEICTHFRNNST